MTYDWAIICQMLGAGIAIGFGAIGAGIGEGFAAGKAAESVSRQPSVSDKVLKTMLIGQAVSESSGIYALVISLLLIFANPAASHSLVHAAGYLGAGIAMGMGAFGPAFGVGFAGGKAVEAMGRCPHHESTIIKTMLIGQAVSESTSIYSLVVALLLIFVVK